MDQSQAANHDGPSTLYRRGTVTFADIWTVDRGMRRCIEKARLVAQHDMNVLILGETGTGKNLLAQAIHNASARRTGPFVAVNIASLPPNLLTSELFGCERGAFTEARSRAGYFEKADGGTLFIDEIGGLSLESQQALLTAVEEKRVTRVGTSEPIPCDVRLVTATNLDLAAAIEDGSFRRDLYHRIARIALEVPPLRERTDDIPMLAARFLVRANVTFGRDVRRIADACLTRLLAYPWPGNVRELCSKIESAMVYCLGDTLEAAHAFPDVADAPGPSGPAETDLSLEAVERRHIARVLQLTGGNRTRAAKLLAISRRTLLEKISRYGICLPGTGENEGAEEGGNV